MRHHEIRCRLANLNADSLDHIRQKIDGFYVAKIGQILRESGLSKEEQEAALDRLIDLIKNCERE